jgi:hypothetical protein
MMGISRRTHKVSNRSPNQNFLRKKPHQVYVRNFKDVAKNILHAVNVMLSQACRVRRYAKNTLGSVLTCIYKGCVSQNTLKIRSDTPGYIDTSDKH